MNVKELLASTNLEDVVTALNIYGWREAAIDRIAPEIVLINRNNNKNIFNIFSYNDNTPFKRYYRILDKYTDYKIIKYKLLKEYTIFTNYKLLKEYLNSGNLKRFYYIIYRLYFENEHFYATFDDEYFPIITIKYFPYIKDDEKTIIEKALINSLINDFEVDLKITFSDDDTYFCIVHDNLTCCLNNKLHNEN